MAKAKKNNAFAQRTGKKPTSPDRTNISINLSVEKAKRFQKATEQMELKPSMVIRAFIEMFAERNPILERFTSELEKKPVKYFKYG